MPIYLKRLAILIAAIVVVASLDGAIRGMSMPPQADTQLSASTQDLIAKARAERDRHRATNEPQPQTVIEEQTTFAAAPPQEDPSDGRGMTTADLHLAWEADLVHIVDARPARQYGEGRIPGAYSISVEELDTGYPAALDILPYEGPIVVYCDGGDCNASRNVASRLIEMGFENVSIFERGLEAWIDHGFPIESDGGM